MAKLSEKLKLQIDVTSQNAFFQRLGWGKDLPEISRLLGIAERHDAAVERKLKEAPSDLQQEELSELRAKARDEVRAWGDEVRANFTPRVASAKNELAQAIGKRLSKGDGPVRTFLWNQLAAVADPLKLQELYHGGTDEVRAAIATLPPVYVQTDFGARLMAPIDPDYVLAHEATLHPEAKRAVDVLETIERSLLGLGEGAARELGEG